MTGCMATHTQGHALLYNVAFTCSRWLMVKFFAGVYISAAYHAAVSVSLMYGSIKCL